MHRHVAQRALTYGLVNSTARRTRSNTILFGPSAPTELLILATSSHNFSTCSSRRRRDNAKDQGSTWPVLQKIPIPSESIPPSQIDEPFRRLERYLQAPYPRKLLPINNELLRNEVFRVSRPNGQSVSKQLPQAYYHTALEKKGDDLTRLIADEVAIYWCLQYTEDYDQAARFLNKHSYHPVSALIRNTHWTVLSRQFLVHAPKFDQSDSCSAASRLADNFEAYIYALYLDQGLETVYQFLCPIFLKKLYSQARALNLPIPKEKRVMDLKEDGTFSRPGPWVRFKFAIGQLLNKKKPAMIRRIEYKGLALPDWEVPCSNGNDCNRPDCYFDHTGTHLPKPPLEIILKEDITTFARKPQITNPSDTVPVTTTTKAIESSEDNELLDEEFSSSHPIDSQHLEKGVFKRIDALMNSKADRVKRDLTSQMEEIIRNKLKLELITERKQNDKFLIAELSKMLNAGEAELPTKIAKIVQSKTKLIADKSFEKIVKQYSDRSKNIEGRLTILEVHHSMLDSKVQESSCDQLKIGEMEERIAVLEKAFADQQ